MPPTSEPQLDPKAEAEVAAIRHFHRIARQGKHPGSSSGEKSAHKIAKLLHKMAKDYDLASLDGDAVEGLVQLLRRAAGPWPTDASKEAVFKTIRQCAGLRR